MIVTRFPGSSIDLVQGAKGSQIREIDIVDAGLALLVNRMVRPVAESFNTVGLAAWAESRHVVMGVTTRVRAISSSPLLPRGYRDSPAGF